MTTIEWLDFWIKHYQSTLRVEKKELVKSKNDDIPALNTIRINAKIDVLLMLKETLKDDKEPK